MNLTPIGEPPFEVAAAAILLFLVLCPFGLVILVWRAAVWIVRARRQTHDAVTPHWVNEHAYDRDHGDDQDPRR